ncbi:3-hydroxy-3-methylglutaryl-coenzyme A reductase [Culicoides brevitarsis]|uniref:3-hydroxy-3-methylglutaryl-coenzyme A reductase n=1 Tax=Culicoides brevitarsis TaxID=469753 RepID=UPI00307B2FE4
MIGKLFRAHGEFCASHPWEVILALLTLTACMLTVEKGATGPDQLHYNAQQQQQQHYGHNKLNGFEAADLILMTIVRCSAVLYSLYQFKNIQKLGSKCILGIAGLFTVFSSFIFTTSVVNFLGSEVSDLKDAVFFFLLLIDLSKAGLLAQLALSGSSQSEVTSNIAKGMEILGPALTLDTVVETLVIGMGTLSGVHRLELLCGYAVMGVIVNYIVFMTFYPASLSLILDLTTKSSNIAQNMKIKTLLIEEEQKPNPVVQSVKIIMSTGLTFVHIHSRFTFSDKDVEASDVTLTHQEHITLNNKTEPTELSDYIMGLLTISAEQIVILILLIALLVKFIFFEGREDLARLTAGLNEEVRHEQVTVSVSTTQIAPLERQESVKKVIFTLEEGEEMVEKAVQTEKITALEELEPLAEIEHKEPRPLEECLEILNSESGPESLTDEEVIQVIKAGRGYCPLYKVESVLGDPERGVKIRRSVFCEEASIKPDVMSCLPYKHYDYSRVMNACCENVLGYVQVPVGYAGPLMIDGEKFYVPMATTEGALVASTNRGCKAISVRGVKSFVEDIGMTRAPCVKFPSILRAAQCKRWIESHDNYERIKTAFDSTSRFARLQEIMIGMDGPQLYIRFRALTGDAMGMNMVSKGAETALRIIARAFPDMEIISLSGNFCSDKKPAAINWIKGRGKRVVCEAIVPADKLRSILKTNAKTLVQCNKLKNMSGSAMAGSIGGNNAHAANMVTAIFIATGQDPAQNVTSSNCSTHMEPFGDDGEDLYITCTMPSLEVGTVGGGTVLPGQSACLDLLGIRGAHPTHPAENARQLARVICATVMAGELSLMAALVNSDLVKSHMRHNRSSIAVNSGAPGISGQSLTPSQASELFQKVAQQHHQTSSSSSTTTSSSMPTVNVTPATPNVSTS